MEKYIPGTPWGFGAQIYGDHLGDTQFMDTPILWGLVLFSLLDWDVFRSQVALGNGAPERKSCSGGRAIAIAR